MKKRLDLIKLILIILTAGVCFQYSHYREEWYCIRWWLFLLGIAVIVAAVGLTSFMKRRENMWAFFIMLCASVSFNLRLSRILYEDFLYDDFFFVGILYRFFIYMMLLAVEEIALGLIVRVIWPVQKRY